jgi:hypothetical protein
VVETQGEAMTKERPVYLSYLLRLWRVDDTDESGEEMAAWRASLQSAHSSERQTFASLDDVVGYLREQMGESVNLSADERHSQS